MVRTKSTVFCLCFALAVFAQASEAAATSKSIQVVMLGDSLTRRFDWAGALPGITVHNLGVDGDTSAGVLARLDGVIAKRADEIFLQIGINDLCRAYFTYGPSENLDEKIRTIFENHKKIWSALRRAAPDSRLYVCACLPVSAEFNGQGRHINRYVRGLNAMLEKEARTQGFVYLDVYGMLSDESGCLAQEYSLDGIHLLPAGYKVWLDAVPHAPAGPRGPRAGG